MEVDGTYGPDPPPSCKPEHRHVFLDLYGPDDRRLATIRLTVEKAADLRDRLAKVIDND